MKVLRCKLSFIWFDKNGLAVVKYFESHLSVAMPWTHEIDCAKGLLVRKNSENRALACPSTAKLSLRN